MGGRRVNVDDRTERKRIDVDDRMERKRIDVDDRMDGRRLNSASKYIRAETKITETDKVFLKGTEIGEGRRDGQTHRQEILKETPVKYHSSLCPLNLEEEKQRFLTLGLLPRFQLKQGKESVESMMQTKRKFQIRFDLFNEASRILDTVKQKYGDGDRFLHCAYGEPIHCPDASEIIYDYLKENAIDDNLQVLWSNDISCSGRMTWHGPALKKNRPEERKYTLWLKNSTENAFLREKGITCLADHEIGTHYFRMCNDGLQPWFASRDKFGIKSLRSYQLLRTEEGLATINTVLNARVKYLWYPALLYYSACMASEMTFKELFDHLALYIRNDEQRWKHVMRIKRGLQNPNDLGGCGKDQCYFEGAIDILRQLDSIDFRLLMAGKICLEDLPRVKRMARQDCIKIPLFMRDMQRYRRLLKQIAQLNGIPTDGDKRERNIVPSTNFDVFLHKVKMGQLMMKVKSSPRHQMLVPTDKSIIDENGNVTEPEHRKPQQQQHSHRNLPQQQHHQSPRLQQQLQQQYSPRNVPHHQQPVPRLQQQQPQQSPRFQQRLQQQSAKLRQQQKQNFPRSVLGGDETSDSVTESAPSDAFLGLPPPPHPPPPPQGRRRLPGRNVSSTSHAHFRPSQGGIDAVASTDALRSIIDDQFCEAERNRKDARGKPWRKEGDAGGCGSGGSGRGGAKSEESLPSQSPPRRRNDAQQSSKQSLVTELYSARSARRVSNLLNQQQPQQQRQQKHQQPSPTRTYNKDDYTDCRKEESSPDAAGRRVSARQTAGKRTSSLTRARSLSCSSRDIRKPLELQQHKKLQHQEQQQQQSISVQPEDTALGGGGQGEEGERGVSSGPRSRPEQREFPSRVRTGARTQERMDGRSERPEGGSKRQTRSGEIERSRSDLKDRDSKSTENRGGSDTNNNDNNSNNNHDNSNNNNFSDVSESSSKRWRNSSFKTVI